MMRVLLLGLCLLIAVPVHGAGTPRLYPEIDGTIHAALVAGNFLFLGGEFTVDGEPRNLAQIDLEEGSVNLQWGDSGTNGPVHALALSVNGNVLYAGGEFTTFNNLPRQNLVAIGVLSGNLVSSWQADVDGASGDGGPAVHALAVSPAGNHLYVGGEFLEIGGEPRTNLARVAISNGAPLPWVPGADGPVRALALDDAHGQIFAGGGFTEIGGETFNGLAAVGVTSARARAASPALAAGAEVQALIHDGERLLVGGEFAYPAEGTPSRTNLAAFDTSPGVIALADWEPPEVDAMIRALAHDEEGRRIFIGGDFDTVGDTPRQRLAALRLEPLEDDDEDDRIQSWSPGLADVDRVHALAAGAERAFLYAGGEGVFGDDGAEPVSGLAGFPVALPVTVPDPPGGGHQELLAMALSCEPRSGADCRRICYTVDGTEPQDLDADCVAGDDLEADNRVTIPWPDTGPVTTLRFFSEDGDGHREPLRTEEYAIDTEAPATTAAPLPLPDGAWFGLAELEPVTLSCEDNHIEFGCTTWYTRDGSEPVPGEAELYTGSIELGDPGAGTVDEVELRFRSVDDAGNEEPVQEFEYRIDLAPPSVAVSQPSGTYVAPLTLEVSCDDGDGSGCAAIYYTTDDRDPVLDADGNPVPPTARYEGPLSVSSATVLKVLAFDEAGNETRRTLGIYALSQPGQETRSGVGSLNVAVLAGLLFLVLLLRRRLNAGSGASR